MPIRTRIQVRAYSACTALFFAGLLLLAGCWTDTSVFERVPSERTGITFANTITDNDTLINAASFDNVYNGGGVAISDLNNDGLPDVIFTGNMVSNRIYLNRGDFRFEDVTEKAGFVSDYWSTGVVTVDINQDGRLDIYVSVAGNVPSDQMANKLYVNTGIDAQGTPHFIESADAYGIADQGFSVQSAFFDYDRDNDLDLFVLTNALDEEDKNAPRVKNDTGTSPHADRLYRNNGNGTFTNVSLEAGIREEGYGLGLVVSDVNNDGWPDIYCANDFVTNDVLYVNNGDGTFTNRAADYLKHQTRNGMGADLADINNDGLIDIFVLDMLPLNRKREKLMVPYGSYGLNRQLDTLGYQPQTMRNTLQLNNGPGPDGTISFSEIGQLAGISASDWSWAPLFADFDNDGFKDLFISNGYRKDVTDLDFIVYGQRSFMAIGSKESINQRLLQAVQSLPPIEVSNFVFRNNGDLTFANVTKDWGLDIPSVSQGSAYGDLDNDGDLDLVVNNMDREAFVFRNTSSEAGRGRFLRVKLEGPAGNRAGYGARIVVHTGAGKQYQEASPYRGFQSTVDPVLHFGLGEARVADSVEVFWSDGRYQVLRQVNADQVLSVDHGRAGAAPVLAQGNTDPLFVDAAVQTGIAFRHFDEEVNDFFFEPLLPHKLTEQGPGLATGDVNGDGLEDFFVGADRGRTGTFFLQQASGRFTPAPLPEDTLFEDMGAMLFDADADSDLDLYVVSGGSLPPLPGAFTTMSNAMPDWQQILPANPDSSAYQDRLYLNDGRGRFTRSLDALPETESSGSVVTAADYDADGDLDLYIGGRLVPQKWGQPARSHLLRNDSRPGRPRFTDVTAQVAPDLARPGMVTAALWTDFDTDGKVDLVVAGEWMPVRFFRNTGRAFEDVTARTGVGRYTGFWSSLVGGDFDNDGDTDYVAGNLGTNSGFHPTMREPVRLYTGDLDLNRSFDAVITSYVERKEYPIAHRDAMIQQMKGLQLRFATYGEYAEATLDKTFRERELKHTVPYEATTSASMYIENRGRGKFAVRSLPARIQFAPVAGMLVLDVNRDGNLDLMAVGNTYGTTPQTGALDASIGGVYLGNGEGGFTYLDHRRSGFFVDGDARALALVVRPGRQNLILATQNDDSLRVFAPKAGTRSRVIKLDPLVRVAHIRLASGKVRREEVYFGSGYLSQSSRYLDLNGPVRGYVIEGRHSVNGQIAHK